MKKRWLILISIVAVIGIGLTIFFLSKNNESDTDDKSSTVAETLVSNFKKEIKDEKDIKKIATTLSTNKSIKIKLDVFDIEEGDYIAGFDEEITGFKKAVGVAPMISTIPFIMYIFEVEDASKFAQNLESHAQLNWNICTQADEMKTSISGNFVFFIMSPYNFQD